MSLSHPLSKPSSKTQDHVRIRNNLALVPTWCKKLFSFGVQWHHSQIIFFCSSGTVRTKCMGKMGRDKHSKQMCDELCYSHIKVYLAVNLEVLVWMKNCQVKLRAISLWVGRVVQNNPVWCVICKFTTTPHISAPNLREKPRLTFQ